MHLFCIRVRFGRSRSSKVDDFVTNRKRVCDFLLVSHCDYGPILHCFWDTATYWLKIDDDQAISCFKELGERCIPAELNSGELPAQVKGSEHFVCSVYSSKGPTTLPWELFRSKNLEGEMLPPTRATLLPHILRVNYITMRDKSYQTNCPELPPIEGNGWNLKKRTIRSSYTSCASWPKGSNWTHQMWL